MRGSVCVGPALAGLLAAAACASSNVDMRARVTRAGAGVPDAFVLQDGTAGAGSAACRNPLYDPRDRTEIRLVRSGEGRGDYDVPAGKYGVGQDELLRVDCASGRSLGVVPRGR